MAVAIVSGAVASKPWNGGATWTRLSWVLGLRRLGWRVYLLEQSEPAPDAEALDYFRWVVTRFGLTEQAALVDAAGNVVAGAVSSQVLDWAREADLLLNLSGHLSHPKLLHAVRRRVYIDLDPGYTQLWGAGARLEGHDVFFTVAENLGKGACPLPACEIEWRAVRQPVVLDEWPLHETSGGRFTTVGSWRGAYGPVEHEGRIYGLKVHEFRKVLELPERAPQTFELALDIHPDERRDLAALQEHGWKLVDPREVAGDPDLFRRYVQGSGAEFSVAQGIYVETNSGWFSDRTTRYLASGKPALVQDTGFSRTIPTGEGLLAFRTLDEAVAGAQKIAADYDRHAHAARAIAEEYFDSDKVLARMLEDALA